MVIHKFLQWSATASAGERARAARLLARAYLVSNLTSMERNAADQAIMFLLDDPSPKVRLALAEAFASSKRAPRPVVSALARDQVEIAGHLISVSPVLNDGDLVDLVADGRPGIQRAVALRANLSVAVSAALAEVGQKAAVFDLLENITARVASVSLRRIAERFARESGIRAQLLERRDLPCDVRHLLILQIGDALSDFALVTSTIGVDRVARVTREACQSATLRLAGEIADEELPALVEHLRISGNLTPSFLIRTLCAGNVDFFAAAIVGLSGYGGVRVRGILVDGRNHAIRALYRAAGLTGEMADLFIDATLMWRDVGRIQPGDPSMSIPRRLIERHCGRAKTDPMTADLLLVIEKMELAAQRQNAREFAASYTRQAA